MSNISAWIIKIEDSMHAAVSSMEMAHIINNPKYIQVPKTPEYCQYMIIWNNNIIPVIDLSAWLRDGSFSTDNNIIAIMIYRDTNGSIQYGGIALSDSPVLEDVKNQQISHLPTTFEKWASISLSCFKNKDNIEVPILDIGKIFSEYLSNNITNSYLHSYQ